ncbi:SPOR domain-containing protein [Kitasatospora kazusensis]
METAYRVMRQDDNGNRFLVAKGLTRPAAEELAAEFEARGHKQLYWVERDGAVAAGA